MPVDLVLTNAKIHAHRGVIQAGLAIDGDRIVRIAKDTNLPSASQKIDLDGRLVLPGPIDAHVHLRGQKLEYKEDFSSGTAAAANGGVTLVVDMPNNKPVTMNLSALRKRMDIAARKTIVNVAFCSAFPERIEEMQNIVQEGAKAFKLYMHEKIGGINPDAEDTLIKAFREAARLGVPVAVHAEDRSLMEGALTGMRRQGNDDVDAYLQVHSTDAEVEAIRHAVEMAKKGATHVHICHVSTAGGVEIISSAKRAGLPVTCEVTPHHLLLSSRHLRKLGAVALTNPPLRPDGNVQSLWSALQTGLADILASDHAPHAIEEKEVVSVWETAPGIAGLETLLPLMLTQVNKGCLSLSDLVRLTSEMPAQIFGLKDRGGLKEGNFADLAVVDLKEEWRIDSSQFRSKASFSPFDGWIVKGKPVKTFVNGRLVMDEGEITGNLGDGRVIR